jgi:hypothetical protein
MAADLRGDLLGAEADLTTGEVRWLSPLPLWTGILAGPAAWACDLGVSYALVKWTCSTQRQLLLLAISPMALGVVTAGAAVSWLALRQTPAQSAPDGGDPRERARFMAILGLASNALFALAILAGAIPRWVLDACQ